jgi:hypothetical protein
VNQETGVDKCRLKRSNTWLNDFAKNVTSQYGEDGIIEKVLDVINDRNKWCVEFGCWDGKTLSNTFNLIDKEGYRAVLIEGDEDRYKDLCETYKENKKVIHIHCLVGFEECDCLDSVLRDIQMPIDFDLLSIDVDGNDYHILKAVEDYKPKVVLIEFNPTIPPQVEFVQPRDMAVTQGSGLLSIKKLAKSKGYELVCTTTTNAIFVDEKYFHLFGLEDNSAETMMVDKSLITHIFCGYDGSVFIRGHGKSPWHQIPYKESKMQLLPRWAIKRYGDKNPTRRKLGRLCRRWLKE